MAAQKFLTQVGAVWKYSPPGPHAEYLIGGFHSDFYFNSEILNVNDKLTDLLIAQYFSESLLSLQATIDWVCSYLPFGSGIANGIARAVSSRTAFMEIHGSEKSFQQIEAGQRVLMVADDIFTGGSLLELERVLLERGAILANEIFVFGNFSGASKFKEYSIVSVFEHTAKRWTPEECPLCAAGSPALRAREHWQCFIDSSRKDSI